ncbi:MAG: CHASE2 domain-containing protein, partial [Thermoanaerobaculia bacterium]
PPGALSAEVWSVLRDCLAKDPDLRPATARETVRRLRAAAGRERRTRWLRAEAPRRALLAIFLAAAVPVAGLLVSSGLPAAERWAYDLRVRTAPAIVPDPRILLVTLDERSTSLANRADEIGGTLDRVFAAGARGVAIDVVLREEWSRSQAFSDLVLRHPANLTLAAFSAPGKKDVDAQGVAGLTAVALGPGGAESLFGFVNLDEDPDGVVRHGRLRFRDVAGHDRPSWAARAAATAFSLHNADRKDFWIDHRIDPAGFDRISLRDVPGALASRPQIFRDRLVLVGDQDADDDAHRIPRHAGREERVSGLELQALQVATFAAGLPVREAPRAPFLAFAALWTALTAAVVLLVRRPGPALAVLLGSLLLYLGLSISAFRQSGLLWPVTPILLPFLIALALAVILRRALSPIPRKEEA